MVDEMFQYTGSVYRHIRALTERRKPTQWGTTECDKLKNVGRARTQGGPDPDSILVAFCVFVVVNSSMSDAE